MKGNIVQKLTSKDDKYACAFTDRIVHQKMINMPVPLLIELLQKAMIQMNGMNTLRMLLRCSTIQSHW